MCKACEGSLVMAWNRVVETPADAVRVERAHHRFAIRDAYDLEVMHRGRVRVDVEHAAVRAFEERAVEVGGGAAGRVPAVEPLQLDRQDRGLERIEAAVAPRELVLVLGAGAATVVGERADLAGQLGVVGGDATGVAERTEVLAGVEAECPRDAERAGGPVAPTRALGLRGVLDERDSPCGSPR